ncbi:MAG TPA: hypothetical protein VMU62_04790 [Acidobacteriaceae bacterium]|nr:hypothetical protein [Acidobacteriaceae bacterium]
MRRILQLSTLVLILTVLITPISEAFDRWDPPGLGHDTEFAIFAFVFSLVLVLLVSQLTAMLRQIFLLLPFVNSSSSSNEPFLPTIFFLTRYASPATSPPLRI